MSDRLKGKVAVVTGGSSGIGFASAKLFIQEGARVVITGRNHQTLNAAAKELGNNALAIRADVSELSDLDDLYRQVKAKFDRIDVLFANAGIATIEPFEHVTEESFGTMFNVNAKGTYFTVQKAIPLLSKGASVILTTTAAVDKGMPGLSVYAASKAAVTSLARSMAAELVGRGIRVNSLSPGPVETPISGKMGLTPEQAKGMFEHITSHLPMKRMAHADELAKVALFLASDASSFMLGSEVSVDGGMTMV